MKKNYIVPELITVKIMGSQHLMTLSSEGLSLTFDDLEDDINGAAVRRNTTTVD